MAHFLLRTFFFTNFVWMERIDNNHNQNANCIQTLAVERISASVDRAQLQDFWLDLKLRDRLAGEPSSSRHSCRLIGWNTR
jgi:hypothetical protein